MHLEADWSELRGNRSLRNALVESIGLRRVFYNLLRSHVRQSLDLRRSIQEELIDAGMAVPRDTTSEIRTPVGEEEDP
ncbi:MAG: hypothetical protein ACOC8K_02265 [Gemmatimonadota bacterium]